MVINSPDNELKLDVLKELGNIGVGNATTALSQMLNFAKVEMFVPDVCLMPLGDIPDLLGGAEKVIVGIYIKAPGVVSFYMVFLLSQESAGELIAELAGVETRVEEAFGRSVLLEVGNIIMASFLNALSFMTNLTFLPTPPLMAVDMAGAVLGTVLADANVAEDYILVLKTAFATAAGKIEGNFLIIPDVDSLDLVVNLLLNGACR
ncbi:MAG: chemotaxis protein CheC [Firmicutes bacterium]|nr:chemotaxis protein CheC [Bacillota bacterium]